MPKNGGIIQDEIQLILITVIGYKFVKCKLEEKRGLALGERVYSVFSNSLGLGTGTLPVSST